MIITQCSHYHTRCLHGDEILYRMKFFFFRFWKKGNLNRQVCMDCNKTLDRDAICTTTGLNLHEWNGIWNW